MSIVVLVMDRQMPNTTKLYVTSKQQIATSYKTTSITVTLVTITTTSGVRSAFKKYVGQQIGATRYTVNRADGKRETLKAMGQRICEVERCRYKSLSMSMLRNVDSY